MAIRDLRTYAESLNGNVFHYRDESKLEVDAVIHLKDGRYGLCEIKLFSNKGIEEAAVNLKKLASSIDDKKMKAPSFLMVITAGNLLYRRNEDNVWVVPLTCLMP